MNKNITKMSINKRNIMSVINLLSTSLSARSEIPNQKLAGDLVKTANAGAIKQLVENLQFNKDKKIQSDCIKVLYEIGYLNPYLISEHLPVFVKMLTNKNNRLVWGAMIAIDTITDAAPAKVYSNLAEIMQAIDKGSVITIDSGVEILAKLAAYSEFEESCFPLLMEQLKICPPKQLGQYAEKALRATNSKNKEGFTNLMNSRIPELEKDTQRKRISAVIKKLG